MNREAKTPSALIALARNRRMQRAYAHAQMHRYAPMPTLPTSLGFMMSTSCVTDDTVTPPAHHMTLLGVAVNEGLAYVVEELGPGEMPAVYRLWLRGPRMGHLVPMHAWYEPGTTVAQVRARIAELAPRLEAPTRLTREAWMLSTRIVHRRAVRISGGAQPVRSFALQLLVEPVAGAGASGKTTVTAFLRPSAQLVDVWALPGLPALAIARVAYTGLPAGMGLDKDTMVLLSAGLVAE